MKLYELFIDELGQSNPLSLQSNVYILCGCVIEKPHREFVRARADQIKFKYWGKTNIVLHSRDLGKNESAFSIFKNRPRLKEEFLNDLFTLLKISNIAIFAIVVDKQIAREKGWNSVKTIKETARKLFYHFIVWLLAMGDAKGKINVESATSEKDAYYLRDFSYFLSPGCKELVVDYRIIQDILTSISFVTKRNHDLEEQIADLFAYAIKCKFMRLVNKKTYKIGSYEDRMIKILEGKLFKKPRIAREKKMKFYETIDPFCIIPRK